MEANDGKGMTAVETEIALRPGHETGTGINTADAELETTGELVSEVMTGSHPGWPVVDWLPVLLAVGLPIPVFRVRDLLALEIGSVIATEWPNGDDLPLSAGAVQLAWVDMETVEQSMAVRLTRLL